MNLYRVTFVGHRTIENKTAVAKKLEELLTDLFSRSDYVQCLVGNNGEFDDIVKSVVQKIQREDSDCPADLILVLATPQTSEKFAALEAEYDDIDDIDWEHTPPLKYAIAARNRYMIDRSTKLYCYVERNSGGAYKMMQHALKDKIEVYNIAEMI